MATVDQSRQLKGDTLYQQYGTPLEAQHLGQYVAIAPDGRTVLGSTVLEVMQQASTALGPGAYIFKVGPRSVGKWR